MWLIMDMKRFLHLLWTNLTSCHFSFFLKFTPLYIFLIYGVCFNNALQDFDDIVKATCPSGQECSFQRCTLNGYLKFHYYKMWVQFINICSLDQWTHYFFTSPHSIQPINSLKIQWNHLAYKDTFCCSVLIEMLKWNASNVFGCQRMLCPNVFTLLVIWDLDRMLRWNAKT